MRVPLSWLTEFIAWNDSATELAERLTMAGLAIEDVQEVGRLDPRIRVGRLVAVEPHPAADRLAVCRVDVGEGAPITVISGAPGLAVGQRVPVALPGARLPGGTEVAAVELRGVGSSGVVCSEAELDLGEEAGRVLELEGSPAPGTLLTELPGIADTVLEAEVTPNRGDWLSILGIARELAALTGARLRHRRPRVRESGSAAADAVRVRVEAPDLCPRYCARVVRGVVIGTSPFWLRLRLRRAGMRAINDVVDATNYVMIERGQPLHAFDLDRLPEPVIVVRRAGAGERMVTLDGIARVLEERDLVIAAGPQAVAIAGVMGGQSSEVSDATRTLLLESAFFTPSSVRRTSRRLGLPSQAAYRFERRVDPAMVPEALDAGAALIGRFARGEVAPGIVEDAPGLDGLSPPSIRLRRRRAIALLGMPITRAEISARLRALGARCRAEGDTLDVTPPSYRGDLVIEEDLIEEVARAGGYDMVPITLPVAPITGGEDSPAREWSARIRARLVAEGLAEMVTVTFTDAETNRRLPGFIGRDLVAIAVRNPLSSESGELRRSPLVGLVRALCTNADRGAGWVGAFEIGKGYGVDATGESREARAVAFLLWGTWPSRGAERAGPPVDFEDLKGIATNLLTGLGIEAERLRWPPAGEVGFLHPGKAAVIEVDGRPLGVAGALHPETVQVFDLAGEVWVCELDFADLAHYVPRRPALRPLPRFPAVTRDIAVVVEEAFLSDAILEEVRQLRDSRIESARLFDCYRGSPIPSGKKSLAYTISYRAPDRTLTDDEVNALHDRVRAHLRDRFPMELRS